MSNTNRIEKFLARPVSAPPNLVKTPVLVTSSKGVYLRRHTDLISEYNFNLKFQCQPGGTFKFGYSWLNRNIHQLIKSYGQVHVYVWLGTCDLTNKAKSGYIALSHDSDAACEEYVKEHVDKIKTFLGQFPTVSFTFLEIPPYSIKLWNQNKGHKHPAEFDLQDSILARRITILNSYLQQVNQIAGVSSIRFNLDLLKYSRAKRPPSICFNLFKDGIHPSPILARCWMKRLLLKIFEDCA